MMIRRRQLEIAAFQSDLLNGAEGSPHVIPKRGQRLAALACISSRQPKTLRALAFLDAHLSNLRASRCLTGAKNAHTPFGVCAFLCLHGILDTMHPQEFKRCDSNETSINMWIGCIFLAPHSFLHHRV